MKKDTKKNVSRETPVPEKLIRLFSSDPDFISSFDLLSDRGFIRCNTDLPGFVLFWLRAAAERGYLPLLLFDKERDAETFYADALSFFCDDTIAWLPFFDTDLSAYRRSAQENHLIRFLSNLYENSVELIITSDEIFERPVTDKQALKEHLLSLDPGLNISFSTLTARLDVLGYVRSDLVEHCGEYALRGGIVDIYPFGETYPLRLEFFGDTLESMRRFNPSDQISFEECTHATVPPASASVFSNVALKNVLPERTLLVRIGQSLKGDSLKTSVSERPFLQVHFSENNPDADVSFVVVPASRPINVRDNNYYDEILKEHRYIIVFSEHDVVRESLREKFGSRAVFVCAQIRNGFHYKPLHLAVISARELFQKEYYVNPDKRFIPENASRIDAPDSLRYGNAVVHVDYGVGIYRGIERIDFRGSEQEAMVVEYMNKDKVYVPIRYMNKIFLYGNENPKALVLDRIGSNRWEQTKHTTRRYLRKAAYDLISLYHDRKNLPGYSFATDTPDTRRLESLFPYTETPDQMAAIADINREMEAPRIMDRLVCGDVGFGKTEIAIRAAFKAVYSGKQVAVLVPTTILSFQHYENFRDRLDPFGIRVEYLNRFVSGASLASRISGIKTGSIDVLVGTHKLLSNILLFHDLGLLIIDEEHRFGVNHKDKIRALKRQLDVITLTATPIPRTLQLSLAGLRDISKIDTPPKERLPIATRVLYWNEQDIHAAIERELERGGQVFILNNRISELVGLREKINAMFPQYEARIAHGKLPGPELEKTLLDFYHHRFDILISTTIIESGIDIPNANTLIVLNAHTFGLSQLYQIRGRVGRSYKKAFAYLVVPRGVHIGPAAIKRLQALEYYTDLGSGYQIAMRDLEIRGAGDLFGVEQSGHINRVGYAYFNRLLTEEVLALKESSDPSSAPRREVPDIRLEHPAYFPDNYIENKDIRISFYRSLSDILSEFDDPLRALPGIARLEHACRDRFGPLPEEAVNLFRDARLSCWLKPFYVDTLSLLNTSLHLSFSQTAAVSVLQQAAGRLLAILNAHHVQINFLAKEHLSAEMDKAFLDLFYSGTFTPVPDSMPDN